MALQLLLILPNIFVSSLFLHVLWNFSLNGVELHPVMGSVGCHLYFNQ